MKRFIMSLSIIYLLTVLWCCTPPTDNLLSSTKTISSFRLDNPDSVGIIDEENYTITITVPYGTDVSSLVPSIVQTGVSVSPPSGEAQDFSTEKIYSVTAADGTIQKYTAKVEVGSCTITFNSQSATTEAMPSSKIIISSQPTVVNLPTAPQKSLCTFAGWFTEVAGGGSQFLATTVVSGNITVYAKWTSSRIISNSTSLGSGPTDFSLDSTNTYSYPNQYTDKPESRETVYSTSTAHRIREYTYNSKSEAIRTDTYDVSVDPRVLYRYNLNTYNINSQVTLNEIYTAANVRSAYNKFEYDAEGRKTSEKYYNADGTLLDESFTVSYDETGKENDGTIIWTFDTVQETAEISSIVFDSFDRVVTREYSLVGAPVDVVIREEITYGVNDTIISDKYYSIDSIDPWPLIPRFKIDYVYEDYTLIP